MAKKHSSKTATEKSLQASNPRIQVFDKWAGVNFKDAPLGWEWYEPSKKYPHHQTDLPLNNFVIQNNMVTDMSDSVSTRPDSEVIASAPSGWSFTGVAYLYKHWLFAAFHSDSGSTEHLMFHDINDSTVDSWTKVKTQFSIFDGESRSVLEDETSEITEIGSFEEKLLVLKTAKADTIIRTYGKAVVFTSDISYDDEKDEMSLQHVEIYIPEYRKDYYAELTPHIPNPTDPPVLRVIGMEWSPDPPEEDDDPPIQLSVSYSYTNMWGSTLMSRPTTIYVQYSPTKWNASRYVVVSGFAPRYRDITGVDIWVNVNNNQNPVLATHYADSPSYFTGGWSCKWFGAMENTSVYANAAMNYPQENTTVGPTCRHFDHIDSRMYYWGDPEKPYRLYIGGNTGSEMAITPSLGGGWVDIEPGSGIEVEGVAKWKTASGANIVTILCGNANTNQVKRFNLVEMTSTFTNEIVNKGWEYEEVSNVVGCDSRWGFGVFADGLYCVNRYGLMLTTMTSEYNNQMRNTKISEPIDPIFTERLGRRIRDARMVHVDDVIYIILSEEEYLDDEEAEAPSPQRLDRVILCYDIGKKAWYTFTHDGKGEGEQVLLHAMPIDSELHTEGLGIVSEKSVTLYPTTGVQDVTPPAFDVMLESGELCSRVPMQAPYYVEQLEFRFDHFIGNCDCWIEGVDYYGREFKIYKKFNKPRKDGYEPDVEMREYVEWVRVQKLVESFRITIKGPARFRMTHVIVKAYVYNNLIGMPYGFDARDTFRNRFGKTEHIHHYVEDYNNLRRAIVS